jgi:hypothetical protein
MTNNEESVTKGILASPGDQQEVKKIVRCSCDFSPRLVRIHNLIDGCQRNSDP